MLGSAYRLVLLTPEKDKGAAGICENGGTGTTHIRYEYMSFVSLSAISF